MGLAIDAVYLVSYECLHAESGTMDWEQFPLPSALIDDLLDMLCLIRSSESDD